MRQQQTLVDLVEKHQLLDDAIKQERGHFVSDWNGTHPYVTQFLGKEIMASGMVRPEHNRYLYFDEQREIISAIRDFHRAIEGLELLAENVLAGPGSSSLLLAVSLWILQQGYSEAYYIPPLYYTVHYFLRILGIRLRPISGKHAFEAGATLNLPPRKSLLLLCDPVWFAGRRVPHEKIEAIASWQRNTGSIVVIDGSFQFMQWDDTRKEHSSEFDPESTFRIVSPTKSLAIPFFRFGYMLHPSWAHRELLFMYENVIGGVSIGDMAFARRSLEVLSSRQSNRALTGFLRLTFNTLAESRLLRTRIVPDCGYFIFGVPSLQLSKQVVMDQDYFELEGYPDHVRINLLRARELYLGETTSALPVPTPST